jgi:hypothetical protein
MKELHSRIILENDLIQITIRFDNDFTKTTVFTEKLEKLELARNTSTEQTSRQELNTASKEFHNSWEKENLKLLAGLKPNSIKTIDYTPYIQLQMEIDEIDIHNFIELSQIDRILDISFSFIIEATTCASWNTVLDEIGAYDIVNEGEYTGNGVRIGILEKGGICDTSHTNLKNSKITTLNEADLASPSAHATRVASIIAKIAPDAELFVYGFDSSFDLAWFANNNCSIINCSFSFINNTLNSDGTYNAGPSVYRADIDGLFDYFVESLLITVVVAAGNHVTDNTAQNYNPTASVTSPGLAYNVITVGGIERNWSLSGYKLEYADGACFVSSGAYVKPEISAFFDVNIPNCGTNSGTSFAAPQVTASIALLIEKVRSSYHLKPTRTKAILMATAKKTADYNADAGNFDAHVGAGVVNVESLLTNWFHYITYTIPAGSPSGTQISSYTVSLTAGQELQVALAWFMHYTPGNSGGYITNYSIYIYNSSNQLVAVSNIIAFSNVEMLRYNVPTTGNYRIVVYQAGSMDSSVPGEKVDIAYSIS